MRPPPAPVAARTKVLRFIRAGSFVDQHDRDVLAHRIQVFPVGTYQSLGDRLGDGHAAAGLHAPGSDACIQRLEGVGAGQGDGRLVLWAHQDLEQFRIHHGGEFTRNAERQSPIADRESGHPDGSLFGYDAVLYDSEENWPCAQFVWTPAAAVVLIAGVLFAGPVYAQELAKLKPKDIPRLMEEADKFIAANDGPKAQAYLKAIIGLDPKQSQAAFKLGKLCEQGEGLGLRADQLPVCRLAP